MSNNVHMLEQIYISVFKKIFFLLNLKVQHERCYAIKFVVPS